MVLEIRLTAGSRTEPLGIPAAHGVMLGWSYHGDEAVDADHGAEVIVAADEGSLERGEGLLWRVERVRGGVIRYGGPALGSRQRVVWRVVVRTAGGEEVMSPIGSFEVGLESEDEWVARWISAPLLPLRRDTWDPVPLLRGVFRLDEVPDRARAYVAALGVYRLWINDREVTSHSLLRPGWTDFRIRTLHQTYDLDGLLREGENVVAAELARGWYAGRLGLQREPGFYGEQPALRLQIEARNEVLAASDDTWRFGYGEIMATDLLLGETQDLRQRQLGWTMTGFDASTWPTVMRRDDIEVAITPQRHDSLEQYQEHQGVLVRSHGRGQAVFDFGQNLVGWVRVEAPTLPKADVVVRHGEILSKDDVVWRDNLRSAFQEDRYTTGDGGRHRLEPRHTLHGFRYAEVWGLAPKEPYGNFEVTEDTRVTAVSVTGAPRVVGRFDCSDPGLTRVASMVAWTVRDNFIEVITDCPQRDERLGWLGDAGVIAQTAAYNLDVAAFVAKFAEDAADAQSEEGGIPSYVPVLPPADRRDGAPGWSDGYVRLVHLLAGRYGDLVSAEAHYGHLTRYLAFVDAANPDGIREHRVGSDFADWLSLPEDPEEPTHPGYAWTGARSTSSRRVVATAHTIRSLDQVAEIADWLGRHDDAARHRARAAEVRHAYARAFVDDRGRIEGDTQTVYAQAIGYRILPADLAVLAIRRLAEKLEELGHLTVGIHGVEHILPALVEGGYGELASRLLLRGDMPSWKHMAAMGATTVWEKWDGIRPDGSMSTSEMNSFNHCALGAVGEFLFEGVGGIGARTTVRTGEIAVRPWYVDGLSWARVEHETPLGPVRSLWRREGDQVRHEIELGPVLSAIFTVPSGYALSGSGARELALGAGRNEIVLARA